MTRRRSSSDYENPSLLRLNAMVHRMERNLYLAAARRAGRWSWVMGRVVYRRYLVKAQDNHLLAKWFQHMAEVFDGERDVGQRSP